tara:strand:- start:5490 stop:6500 length:1011 start_codon:yes stop_codon:yes gene_type:complete
LRAKKIAFIVCDSGLGHLIRSLKIAAEIIKLNTNVFFFCNKKKLKNIKFQKNNSLKFINFISGHNKQLNDQNYFYKIEKKIPTLKQFDIVISDNLPEVLKKHKNVVLISNFFWHRIISKFKNYRNIEKILKQKKPLILCNKYVSHPYINKYENVKKLGFFTDYIKKTLKKSRVLLVSEGTSHTKTSDKFYLLKYIEIVGPFFDKIFLDPKYFNDKKFYKFIKKINSSVFLAKYNNQMFTLVSHAIIKPGLGLVTDCVSNNISCYYFYKNFNKEFIYNAKKLENFKIGKILNIKNIINLKKELKQIKIKHKNYSTLKWSAHKQAAKIIINKNKINER